MIFRQYLHPDPVAISYLFGCAGHAAGRVIDAVAVQCTGTRIRYIVDTHLHADHLSAGIASAA